ncbi:hypothetical protein [Streptomyces sp. BPTC-684]|uniref:hypothetical protein n=1 Tax=Streptomyces sp. BPTC-684 TaxID=3043734 RepID=UPI0024B0B60E|nr:hypothetical protein [Streptomyces sp. BPTC-684]WHM40981.1 hypothetical protein QIY60_31675 [Streptomyces sp. BPTC-684]
MSSPFSAGCSTGNGVVAPLCAFPSRATSIWVADRIRVIVVDSWLLRSSRAESMTTCAPVVKPSLDSTRIATGDGLGPTTELDLLITASWIRTAERPGLAGGMPR